MDEFDAPGADNGYDSNWILICQITLVLCGLVYVLIGLVAGGAYTVLPLLLIEEEPDMIIMIPFGLLMGALGVAFGAANIAAAWGLGARTMWGFALALVMAAMYLPSACMPFGAVLGYGLLLHEPTRKQFLK